MTAPSSLASTPSAVSAAAAPHAPLPEPTKEKTPEPEWTEEEKKAFISSLKPFTPSLESMKKGPIVITDITSQTETITFKEYPNGEALSGVNPDKENKCDIENKEVKCDEKHSTGEEATENNLPCSENIKAGLVTDLVTPSDKDSKVAEKGADTVPPPGNLAQKESNEVTKAVLTDHSDTQTSSKSPSINTSIAGAQTAHHPQAPAAGAELSAGGTSDTASTSVTST